MGMAAGQARLLSITSRIADNELRAQIINNNKMRLASQSSQVSEAYIAALNEAELMFSNYDADNNVSYTKLTYNALTSFNPYNNQYALVNSSGSVLISEKDAQNYRDSNGDLETFLKLYGLERSTTFFDNLKTDGEGNVILSDENSSTGFIKEALKLMYVGAAAYDGEPKTITFKRNDGVETPNISPESYFATANSDSMYQYTKYSEALVDAADELENTMIIAMRTVFNDLIKQSDCFGEEVNNYSKLISYIDNQESIGDLRTVLDKLSTKVIPGLSTYMGNYGNYIEDLQTYITNNSGENKITEFKTTGDGAEYRYITDGDKLYLARYKKGDFEKILYYFEDNKVIKYGDLDDEGNPIIIAKDKNVPGGENPENPSHGYDCYPTCDIAHGEEKIPNTNYYLCTNQTQGNDKPFRLLHTNSLSSMKTVAKEVVDSLYKTGIFKYLNKEAGAWSDDKFTDVKDAKEKYEIAQENFLKCVFGDEANWPVHKENTEDWQNFWDKFFNGEYDKEGKFVDIGMDYLYNNFNNKFTDGDPTGETNFQQVYINILLDAVMDVYGEPKFAWIDKSDPTESYNENGDAKARWYTNLFNRISTGGYAVLQDGLASSHEWIQFAFESGIVTMEQIDSLNQWQPLIYSNCSDITSETAEKKIAIAEAEYNAAMNKIENKDKRYDLELKNIDTEHNSLQVEYDSIKEAINKNVERTFKLYS